MFRWLFLGRAIFYQIEMKDTAGLAVIIYEASTSEASRAGTINIHLGALATSVAV
jgi:hypothetical protein